MNAENDQTTIQNILMNLMSRKFQKQDIQTYQKDLQIKHCEIKEFGELDKISENSQTKNLSSASCCHEGSKFLKPERRALSKIAIKRINKKRYFLIFSYI